MLHLLAPALITANAVTTGALAAGWLSLRRQLRATRAMTDELVDLIRDRLTVRIVVVGNGNGNPDDVGVTFRTFGQEKADF